MNKDAEIPEGISKEREFSIEEIHLGQLVDRALVSEAIQKAKNPTKGGIAAKAERSGFTIDSSRIKKLERNGRTTYIFLVKRDSLDLERFENLVAFRDSTGAIRAFLLEYLTDLVELDGAHGSFSYGGDPRITPLSDTGGLELASKQVEVCYSVTVTYCSHKGTHIAGPACLAANDGRTYTATKTNCIWFDDGGLGGGPGGGPGGGGGGPDPGDGFDNSPLGDDLTFKLKNFVKFSLTLPNQRQYFYNATDTFRKQMAIFLDAHDFSDQAKILANWMVDLNHRLNYSMGHTELTYLIENPYWAGEINDFLDTNNTVEAKKLVSETYLVFDNAELADFEQDYKGRMSTSEMAIYDSMSWFKQVGYLLNAQKATWEAEELYPNSQYNGKGDAFRHAHFNGLNAILLGPALAEDLATAHEDIPFDYSDQFKEKQMDLFNNAVGRAKKNWFADGYQSLAASILDAMSNGELRYLSHLQGGGTSGRATNLSQLIPTN